MAPKTEIRWAGWGRWLSFLVSALLILLAVPYVMDYREGAAAGWNIFLGLLLFGAIASGNRHASTLTLVLVGLMAIRLTLATLIGASIFMIASNLLLLILVSMAAYDLRRQSLLRGNLEGL